MNKKFFLHIVAALALTVTFLSCQKDNNEDIKLLQTIRSSEGSFTRYEYDTQNRLTKISGYSNNATAPSSVRTFSYSGNDLVQFDDYALTMVDYTQSAYKLTYSNGSNTYIFDLNSDDTLAKVLFSRADGYSSETNYQYQNGNVTKSTTESAWNGVQQVGTRELTYDSMHSPFLNCNTPRWFLIRFFEGTEGEGVTKNNVTELTGNTGEASWKIIYSYEYDNEGYPTKRNVDYGSGDYMVYYSYTK